MARLTFVQAWLTSSLLTARPTTLKYVIFRFAIFAFIDLENLVTRIPLRR